MENSRLATNGVRVAEHDETAKEEAEFSSEALRRIRSGDSEGIALAYKRYSAGLLMIARKRLIEKERAQDLVHETWAVALVKLETEPDDDTKLRAYLRGILGFKVANQNAATKRQRQWVVPERDDMPDIGDVLQNIPDTVATARQRLELVYQLMGRLTPRDCDLLRSFYFAAESRESICKRLGISPVQFSKLLSRARKRLREKVREWEGEQGT